ncbi:MAG TPA: chemotaxis protein CheW [Terriglobales bacterium]|nr:chemotaxis protein CheW [Terriglobales bacterium]
MEKDLQIVGFRIGRETYGVPITAVHEIVRVPEITAVPDAPDYLEGVINLRGKIVSIIDLRKRFGEAAAQPNNKNRILVAEVNGKLLGLVVDSASEVLRIARSAIEAPPALVQEGRLNCITGVGKLQGRLVILIDLARLLPSSASPARPEVESRSPQDSSAASSAVGAHAGGQ